MREGTLETAADTPVNSTNPNHEKTSLYSDISLSNAPRSQNRQERILDGADKGNPVIQI
jgi:hypothetical protein